MTVFHLKLIALTSMIIDHMGAIIPEVFGLPPEGINLFRVIGRVAFPIFVYLIAEGFRHTKSPEKYLVRLGIFALISEIPFDLAFRGGLSWTSFFENTNIFYTLFLGGAAIFVYNLMLEHGKKRFKTRFQNVCVHVVAVFPTLVFMLFADILTADYGAYGVAFIFIMYVIKPVKFRLAAMATLCIWQHHVLIEFIIRGYGLRIPITYFLMIPATLVPVFFIAYYNGQRGPSFKWWFYAAYPVHLVIVAIVTIL